MSKGQIIITGYGEHGKDTACEYLRDKYNLSFAGSSRTACDLFIFDMMKDAFGYKTADECYNDRHNHRDFWHDAIRYFNKDDLSRLGKIIFEDSTVYCGIRNPEEFRSLKSDGQVDLTLWIDALERKPPEPASSMGVTANDADEVLSNNGTKAELYSTLDDAYTRLIAPIIGLGPHASAPQQKNDSDLPNIKFG